MSGFRPLAVEMLRQAHLNPGITRAEAARSLGIGTGAASDLAASLVNAGLLDEIPVASSGRGRPTREFAAAADGPLVLAVTIRSSTWRLDTIAIGNEQIASVSGNHHGFAASRTLGDIALAVTNMRRRYKGRVRGIGVAAPGTVREARYLDGPRPGWEDVDLRQVWPKAPLFTAGNDATLAAIAESMRGGARSSALCIYLHIEAGLGGAILEHGTVVDGAHQIAGEFGHMPMGDPSITCGCGATGCWGASVDGPYLAHLLKERPPSNALTYARRVFARARDREKGPETAVAKVAQIFGRGTAGLVNALDADLVIVGGLAPDILNTASRDFYTAYDKGLMASRRSTPTPIQPAVFGDDGPLIGAAETAWALVWQQLGKE